MPSFTLDQLPAFEKYVNERIAGALQRGMLSAALRGVGVIQNEIIPAENPPPVDRSIYRAGWRAEPTPEGADLVNSVPWAPIIDGGARAANIKIGRAMIDALTEWAKRKGLDEPRNAAWAIANAMRVRGIFNRDSKGGLRISEKAVERIKAFLPEEIARELARG